MKVANDRSLRPAPHNRGLKRCEVLKVKQFRVRPRLSEETRPGFDQVLADPGGDRREDPVRGVVTVLERGVQRDLDLEWVLPGGVCAQRWTVVGRLDGKAGEEGPCIRLRPGITE